MKINERTIQKRKVIEAVDSTCGMHVSGINEIQLQGISLPRTTYAELVMYSEEKKLSISSLITIAIDNLLQEELGKSR